MARMAHDMIAAVQSFQLPDDMDGFMPSELLAGQKMQIRVGMHSGECAWMALGQRQAHCCACAGIV